MPNIAAGIATLPERHEFFHEHTLKSLDSQVDATFIYVDEPSVLGDAGKFEGFESAWDLFKGDFYFFTCDDDLAYQSDYCERMIEWIEFFERKAVVSLHGSLFQGFPIQSYYRNRQTYFCLQNLAAPQRVLFPGTGCTAFHSSLLRPTMRDFKAKNMADIWFGLLLQKQEIPAICLPHSGDYLTYNTDLPIEKTIWGQEHQDDFLQTAIINQFSLDQGFRLFPFPVPLEGPYQELPPPLQLAPAVELPQ